MHSMHLIKDTFSKLCCLSKAVPIRDVYRNVEPFGAGNSPWWTPLAYLRSKWIPGKLVDEDASASIRASFGQAMLDANAYYLALALGSQSESLGLKAGNSYLIDKIVLASLAKVHYS